MKFEELQEIKVSLAISLLQRLVNEEIMIELEVGIKIGYKSARDVLKVYANTLEEIANIIKDQKKLCQEHTQCDTLLDQELAALEGNRMQIGVIRHIRLAAARSAALDKSLVRQALILIASREHSLEQLRRAVAA